MVVQSRMAARPAADREKRMMSQGIVQGLSALRGELSAAGTSEPAKIDFKSPRSPREAEAARRHFEARLPELAAEYAATPPKLGPALRNYSAKNPDTFGEAKLEDCG